LHRDVHITQDFSEQRPDDNLISMIGDNDYFSLLITKDVVATDGSDFHKPFILSQL